MTRACGGGLRSACSGRQCLRAAQYIRNGAERDHRQQSDGHETKHRYYDEAQCFNA